MGAQLRVILDPGVGPEGADEAEAARMLARSLVATVPTGCTVQTISPAGAEVSIEGAADTVTLKRSREKLAKLWRRGRSAGLKGGLIHAPTLLAPLMKHDRVNENDQTVATMWDLRAWEAATVLDPATVAWQKAMLSRAVRYADAVVVPTHAMAARLTEIARLHDRVRVIAGATPQGLSVPADAAERLIARGASGDYILLTGSEQSLAAGKAAAAASGIQAIVFDSEDAAERAALLSGAKALIATEAAPVWPWRVVEALAMGVPVIAAESGTHRDVIADGGVLADPAQFAEVLEAALGPDAARMRVLARDRSRAFSWASAAERVWSLHADL